MGGEILTGGALIISLVLGFLFLLGRMTQAKTDIEIIKEAKKRNDEEKSLT